METIHLSYVKDGKFISGSPEKNKLLYIIDIGGLLKNNPSFELYQKLSTLTSLWIDSAPRRFEDVMDIVIVGASRVTIRKGVFRDDVSRVFREIEIDLYEGIDNVEQCDEPIGDWKGRIIYIPHELGFKEREKLALAASKVPLYLVLRERNFIDIEWAENVGIKGVIYE